MIFVLGRGNLGGSSQRLSRFVHAGAWTVALLMVCASACARKSESPRISYECMALNEDQKGSLMVPADTNSVIQVQLDSRLSEENQRKIQSAASEWNRLSRTLRQQELFVLVTGVVDEDQYPKTASDCSYEGGGDDRFWIIQENDPRHWSGLGFSRDNPAGTIRCHYSENLERQVIYLNTEIAKPDQLQSIMLHEFGHSLGMDHSCQNGAGTSDYIGCDQVKAGHPYRDAVLFPVLRQMTHPYGASPVGPSHGRRSTLEVKEALQANDQSRARCLL